MVKGSMTLVSTSATASQSMVVVGETSSAVYAVDELVIGGTSGVRASVATTAKHQSWSSPYSVPLWKSDATGPKSACSAVM